MPSIAEMVLSAYRSRELVERFAREFERYGFQEAQHPRGQPKNVGQFVEKGRGKPSPKKESEVGPSAKGNRHTNARPPVQTFVAPPPPQGKAGRKAGGYAATGKTNTETGDLAELVIRQLGLRSILPAGQRQNPLDVEYDHSGYAFEVKAVTTAATEYKAKMKAHEVEEKKAYAKKHGLRAGVMIVVMDVRAKKAHVYWREGIANYRLTKSPDWNYAGTVGL